MVPSVSIENLLRQRDGVIERLDKAMALIREAGQLAIAAGVGVPRFKIDENKYTVYNLITEDPAEAAQKIRAIVDQGGWRHLMDESGLRTFMDAKARDAWNNAIEKGEFPELTDPNIRATFKQMYDGRADMFERGVLECFRRLSWCYKTNKPFAFGKRVVMRFIRYEVKGSGGTALGSVNYRNACELDDLVRVLSVLDGKPEPDHRGGISTLLAQQKSTDDPDVANEYISIRSFRNGNGHITFLRPDLVTKMNRILTKHHPDALAFDHHV